MAKWIEATAADLRRDTVFRFLDDAEDKRSRVTARWDEDGEVKFFSRDVTSDRPEGRSAVRPDHPVLILK